MPLTRRRGIDHRLATQLGQDVLQQLQQISIANDPRTDAAGDIPWVHLVAQRAEGAAGEPNAQRAHPCDVLPHAPPGPLGAMVWHARARVQEPHAA